MKFLKRLRYLGLLFLWSLVAPVSSFAVSDPAKLSDLSGIIQNILKLLAPAAAVAFFVMILVGGFQFLTSGGDPKAVGQARTTLTFAILGVILVVVSYLILRVVFSLTNVDVTQVTVPGGN